MLLENKIPRVTTKRLPLYYRYFEKLHILGIQRVSSTQLSKELQIDSATIRRDLSYLGELGRKGYGYNVNSLFDFLREFLKHNIQTNEVIVGAGNLGRAIMQYNYYRSRNTNIVAAFDKDPGIINRELAGVPIYDVDRLEEIMGTYEVDVAILTVPADSAQKIADRLVTAGVKGILNLTPIILNLPENIVTHNVDLTLELQTLIYYIKDVETDYLD
jgi:redox-sensing transcriptional repressor